MSIATPIKLDASKIVVCLMEAEKTYPDLTPVILHDKYIDLSAASWADTIDCQTQSPATLAKYDVKKTLFIYCCDTDSTGVPFIQWVIKNGGVFLPPSIPTPSRYTHVHQHIRDLVDAEYDYQEKNGFNKWDGGDVANLMQAIDLTRDLPGDFVEVGCYRGSSSGYILRYMHALKMKRRCYFLDVFDGFNYEAALESADAYWRNSHETEGEAVVFDRLKRFHDPANGPDVIVQRNNIITDALPTNSICLANLDVDIYEGIRVGLDKLADAMVVGGIIVVEDSGHTPQLIGARVALDEFMAVRGHEFIPVCMESGQTFLIKR